MTSFPTRSDSQEMKTQGVCLDWTKGGMLKLDYFPEVENMVEWVMLTRCKMLEFTNTLSRECTGYTSYVYHLCRTKTTCFGEPNMCSVCC
jgi:hypothetical protein